jgi:hypothetical protein
MRRMSIRLLIVCIAHILIFEGVCQVAVYCQRELTDELIALFFNFLLFLVLLIWAVLPGFGKINNWVLRFAARTAVVILLFFFMHTVDYFYSWHLRPNLGLDKEPAWVSKYPEFQRKTRARIQKNMWKSSGDKIESQE